MAAGKNDRLVSIIKFTEAQSIGEPTLAAATHSLWWAERLPRGGAEQQAGGQLAYATRNNTWRGLYVAGVDESMKLLEDGVFHDIDVVDETGRRQNILVLHTTQRDTV